MQRKGPPRRALSRVLSPLGELVGVDEILELPLELLEGARLELAYPLAGDAELAADRLQRLDLAVEPEAQLDDPALPLGKPLDRLPHGQPADRIEGRGLRVGRLRIGEQVAELDLVVADSLVQRDGRLDGLERLLR